MRSNPLLQSQLYPFHYHSLHQCHFTVHIIFRLCALTITAFVISATIFSHVNNSFLIFRLNILLFIFFCVALIESFFRDLCVHVPAA